MILSSLSAMLLASLPTALAKPAFGANLVPRNLQTRAANVSCGADPRMPPDSWDSHLHVMDPERYPVNPENPYTPGVYTIWDNAVFESSIGCENVVFVQSTTHGLDMSLMLDSLQAYGPDKARGIALFDHDNVTESQLKAWHEAGVRGVRVNLVTYADEVDEEALVKELQAYADVIRQFD
jgi:predicted TIM-barrel fold metal-dependent hydrolase